MSKRMIPLNDPKLRMLRVASGSRSSKYGMGGREKSGGFMPAKITLPTVAFLKTGEPSERDSDSN